MKSVEGEHTLVFSKPHVIGSLSEGTRKIAITYPVQITPSYLIETIAELDAIQFIILQRTLGDREFDSILITIKQCGEETIQRFNIDDSVTLYDDGAVEAVTKVVFYDLLRILNRKLNELYDADTGESIDLNLDVEDLDISVGFVRRVSAARDLPTDSSSSLHTKWRPGAGGKMIKPSEDLLNKEYDM